MIGKKKTKDVQFYREATDMQFDETGNRKRKHRYGDEEEFEQEQEERRRRAALDREFKGFAEKISDAGKEVKVEVDIPFRELGFNGVPNRSNVLCQPSTDCLVQLTEPPFMVITLEDIEIAHLERVQVRMISLSIPHRVLLTCRNKSLASRTSTWSLCSKTFIAHLYTSTLFPSNHSKMSRNGSTRSTSPSPKAPLT